MTVPEPVPDRATVSVLGVDVDGVDVQELVRIATALAQGALGGRGIDRSPDLAGVACGFACRMSAAAPATCGDAIDVPLFVADATSEAMPAERMPDPGANRSLHDPKFE